jgi:hypothetical protein
VDIPTDADAVTSKVSRLDAFLLVFLAILGLGMTATAGDEERFLESTLKSYGEYRQRVRYSRIITSWRSLQNLASLAVRFSTIDYVA